MLRSALETFLTSLHHGGMPRLRVAILLLLSSFASADIIDDVRSALAQRNSAAADSQLQTYRGPTRCRSGIPRSSLLDCARSFGHQPATASGRRSQADRDAGPRPTAQAIPGRRAASPHRPRCSARSPSPGAGRAWSKRPSRHLAAARSGFLRKYFDQPAPTQKSKFAKPDHTTRAAADYFGVPRHPSRSAEPTQRFPGPIIFLGALVAETASTKLPSSLVSVPSSPQRD